MGGIIKRNNPSDFSVDIESWCIDSYIPIGVGYKLVVWYQY